MTEVIAFISLLIAAVIFFFLWQRARAKVTALRSYIADCQERLKQASEGTEKRPAQALCDYCKDQGFVAYVASTVRYVHCHCQTGQLWGIREEVTAWLAKQGEEQCWYYPDVFLAICHVLDIKATAPDLPAPEVFAEGCKKFQAQVYLKGASEQ